MLLSFLVKATMKTRSKQASASKDFTRTNKI